MSCAFDSGKLESSEPPSHTPHLVFVFMESFDPPLSPGVLNRKGGFFSECLDPGQCASKRDIGIMISRGDPYPKFVLNKLLIKWQTLLRVLLIPLRDHFITILKLLTIHMQYRMNLRLVKEQQHTQLILT